MLGGGTTQGWTSQMSTTSRRMKLLGFSGRSVGLTNSLLTLRSLAVHVSEVVRWRSQKRPINQLIQSMYGIFTTYIWLIFAVNVGKDTIHGCYGQ